MSDCGICKEKDKRIRALLKAVKRRQIAFLISSGILVLLAIVGNEKLIGSLISVIEVAKK